MSTNHLLRRAVDTIAIVGRSDQENVYIPPLAVVIFSATCLAFFVFVFMFSYTYGSVIPILCSVESSDDNVYLPVNTLAPKNEPPEYAKADEPSEYVEPDESSAAACDETHLVRTKPVTTSLRGTVKHLRDRAGYWSRFRGMGVWFVLVVLSTTILIVSPVGTKNKFLLAVEAVVLDTFFANLYVTWIHIIISKPSPKRWWRRLPSPVFQTWRRIAPAVAIWSIASQIVVVLPSLVMSVGSHRYADPYFRPSRQDTYLALGQVFGALLLLFTFAVLVQIPTMVIMTRVAASMLPEEDETIVQFDRTFGGKVTPTVVGGEGKVGLVEAWTSFPWSSRRRLLMLCFKVWVIAMALGFIFGTVLTMEGHLLFGVKAFGEFIKMVGAEI